MLPIVLNSPEQLLQGQIKCDSFFVFVFVCLPICVLLLHFVKQL